VARVAEVGGVSLPGAAHGLCPRRRADHTPSVHGAAAGKTSLVLSKPPVRDTPPTSPPPEFNAKFAGHEEWLSQTASVNAAVALFGISSRVSVSLGVAKSCFTRQRKARRRRGLAWTKNSGWLQHARSLRRRMVGPMSIRQLKKEGPFFSSAPGTDGVWSARLRGQSPCAVPEGHR
jgi:hypothetical protein